MFEISVENLKVPFKGGYYEAERKITQMLEISVRATFSPTGFIEQRALENTLDYVTIQEVVRREVGKGVILLESLALDIEKTLRSSFPLIEKIDLSLRKHPILDVAFDHVEVRLIT